MSLTNTSSLAAGVQQLYNDGLLPSSLNISTLNSASTGQLNSIAGSTIALQELGVILGSSSSSSTDSVSLSSAASVALLQESTSSGSSTDLLTAAVNNALTSRLDAAVDKFSPSSSGGTVNLLG